MDVATADAYIANAMKFFEPQCQDDSDFVEGEFIFDVLEFPKTAEQAYRLQRQFEEDASRWANYAVEDEEESDGDEATYSFKNEGSSLFGAGITGASSTHRDQKFGLQFQTSLNPDSPTAGLNLDEVPRYDHQQPHTNSLAQRISQIER